MRELLLDETLVRTGLLHGPWVDELNIAESALVDGEVWVRRNREHWVGRCRIPGSDLVLTAAPDFDPALFADFFLYSRTGLRRRAARAPAGTRAGDHFAHFVAELFVEVVEHDVAARIARRYRPQVERSQVLRGRPLWDFGRPIAGWVDCRVHWLNVDNRLNRLVLAGLRVAHRLVRSSRSSALLHLFRSLCSESWPTASDFDLAGRQINALTRHYELALELSRALVLRLDPELFESGGSRMVGFELYVPGLFESFLYHLVKEAFPALDVVEQSSDSKALVDLRGKTYRRIRPDVEVSAGGLPLAVLDAKYKPRYMRGTKASTGDLYQLFFYQARLQHRAGLDTPPMAAIVAPSFGTAPPPFRQRVVRRSAQDASAVVNVLDLPLPAVLARLDRGALEALQAAPELLRLLQLVQARAELTAATKRNSSISRAV